MRGPAYNLCKTDLYAGHATQSFHTCNLCVRLEIPTVLLHIDTCLSA